MTPSNVLATARDRGGSYVMRCTPAGRNRVISTTLDRKSPQRRSANIPRASLERGHATQDRATAVRLHISSATRTLGGRPRDEGENRQAGTGPGWARGTDRGWASHG